MIKKFTMAVTGLIMIAFLLMHMYGNLKAFSGAEAFDHYAHWLKGATPDGGILYPIMPPGVFLWVFRFVLVLAILLHIWAAVTLWHVSGKASGRGYEHKKRQVQTYSARTMRWGGIIVFAFIVFHLIQFTIVPDAMHSDPSSAYSMIVESFSQPWVLLVYLISMVLVCMHIRHGFWSAFATLGLNMSSRSRTILNALAYFVAIALFVGFMIVPVAVFIGWIG